MKERVQKFGRFLSGMVMPNIGAFIAWGLIAALFIADGWFPNAIIAAMVSPMLQYLLPILTGYTGGKAAGGQKGAVAGALATLGAIASTDATMFEQCHQPRRLYPHCYRAGGSHARCR